MIRYFFALMLAVASSFTSLQAQMPSPGPEHAKLKALEGTWNFVMKPSEGPEAKGVSVFKLECAGFWLTCDFSCKMGDIPFQGKGIDGYDQIKKKYVSVWVDSMTSSPMIFEGDYDASGKVLTMSCKAPGPEGKPALWRSVSKIISPDEHTFEMFLTPEGGKEASMMIVTYKRAK